MVTSNTNIVINFSTKEILTMKTMKQILCYSLIAIFALQTVSYGGAVNTNAGSSYKVRCIASPEVG